MTGKYAVEHASALADLREAGSAVTFTYPEGDGAYLADVDFEASAGPVTMPGYALRVRGNPKVYEALKLIEADAPTLLFCASTYGDEPALGMLVPFGGHTYSVKSTDPVAPDGVAIVTRCVVAR